MSKEIQNDILNDILSFILNPGLNNWLLILKIIFIVLILVILFLIILILSKTTWLKWFFLSDLFEFFTYKPYGVRKFAKQWAKILSKLETGSEAEYKLAVIEADSLINDILEQEGYKGENLEEKLKKINKFFLPNMEELSQAHLVRNNIVYDPDYKLSLSEAKNILLIYEKALKDLEAI